LLSGVISSFLLPVSVSFLVRLSEDGKSIFYLKNAMQYDDMCAYIEPWHGCKEYVVSSWEKSGM